MTEGELARIYDAHAASLFAFLLNFTRDEGDTRDVLQELFTRIARRPGILDGARDTRGFLIRMAHNIAVDAIRRRDARERAHEALAHDTELFATTSTPGDAALAECLSTALGTLPPEQRAVLQLKIWEDMTFDAIAGALGIPLNTAASRYRYAMDKLRAQLRPLYDELR